VKTESRDGDNKKSPEGVTNTGSRFPGVKDSDLIKVKVGTVKEGSTKITPTQFTLPDRKP